jgi:acetyl-CoA acetyltransferase
MNEVVIVAALRTPIGRLGGVFRDVSALDLTLPVMKLSDDVSFASIRIFDIE